MKILKTYNLQDIFIANLYKYIRNLNIENVVTTVSKQLLIQSFACN